MLDSSLILNSFLNINFISNHSYFYNPNLFNREVFPSPSYVLILISLFLALNFFLTLISFLTLTSFPFLISLLIIISFLTLLFLYPSCPALISF